MLIGQDEERTSEHRSEKNSEKYHGGVGVFKGVGVVGGVHSRVRRIDLKPERQAPMC